jgi:hypothetical protein
LILFPFTLVKKEETVEEQVCFCTHFAFFLALLCFARVCSCAFVCERVILLVLFCFLKVLEVGLYVEFVGAWYEYTYALKSLFTACRSQGLVGLWVGSASVSVEMGEGYQ